MTAEHILTQNGLDPDRVDIESVMITLAQGKLNTAVTLLCQNADCTTRQAMRTARSLAEAMKHGEI